MDADSLSLSLSVLGAKAGALRIKRADGDDPSTASRLGWGGLAGGSSLGAGHLLRSSLRASTPSWLEMGQMLWAEPENVRVMLERGAISPQQAERFHQIAKTSPRTFRKALLGQTSANISAADAELLRRLTFNKTRHWSAPGDVLLVEYTPGGVDGKGKFLERAAVGGSQSHVDVGREYGGWIGIGHGRRLNDPASLNLMNGPSVAGEEHTFRRYGRARTPDPDASAYVHTRPRTPGANVGEIQQALSEVGTGQVRYDHSRLARIATREALPELSVGTRNLADSLFSWLTPRKDGKGSFVQKRLSELLKRVLPEDMYKAVIRMRRLNCGSGQVCSTWAADTLKRMGQHVPGAEGLTSPNDFARSLRGGKSSPYRMVGMSLPEAVREPGALLSQHRAVRWGPLVTRLPLIAGLTGLGVYAGARALQPGSATPPPSMASQVLEQRERVAAPPVPPPGRAVSLTSEPPKSLREHNVRTLMSKARAGVGNWWQRMRQMYG